MNKKKVFCFLSNGVVNIVEARSIERAIEIFKEEYTQKNFTVFEMDKTKKDNNVNELYVLGLKNALKDAGIEKELYIKQMRMYKEGNLIFFMSL